ncbi:hypothetical protein GCM10010191_89130 [Actinomadura vinacea]|uniref:LysM domain-containing protein n=1 Tax=Actinomadura vinacea TaxID=115336 RepID=A0ABN3KCX2_9ACTN
MSPTAPTRLAEIWRGIGALAVLAGLLVACPVLLYAVGGSPLPCDAPAWPEIKALLLQPDTDHALFLGAVRLIGWAAWCLFAAIIAAETIGYLAGRSAPRLPRPIRPAQHLARDLIAMTALIFTTSTALTHPMTSTPAHATSPAPQTTDPRAPASVGAEKAPSQESPPAISGAEQAERPRFRTRIVERGDTLWAIARREYGSGTRYPKIFKASRRLTQPEGVPRLTDPDRIYPGQTLRYPQPKTNKGKRSAASPSKPVAPKNSSSPPAAPSTQPPNRPEKPLPPSPTHSPGSGPTSASRPPVDPPPVNQSSGPQSPPAAQRAEHTKPFAITLPSGAYLGLGLASALSVALAATRLHRRRRRTLASRTWPTPATPEPAPPPAVAQAHRAHLDTYADRDEPVPIDADLLARDLATPIPDQITLGIGPNGAIALPLPGLGLGIAGDGAIGTVRAIATELLARARADRVELLIPAPDAHTLFPDTDITELADALPGLIVPPTLNAAITHLEAEIIRRARLLEDTEEPDLPSLRATDPAEPLPAVLLIASVPEHASNTLHAIVQLGARYGIASLLLGSWPPGTTANVRNDGSVTNAEGHHADALHDARLFNLTATDACGMLQTIRTATGAPEPAPPQPPTETDRSPDPVPPPRASNDGQQTLVQLSLLGPVTLHTPDGPITTGLRRSSRSLLAYLALHPDGVSRDQGTAALWPDHDPDTATTMFHTAISNTRKVLRQATGLREPMFIIHAAGRYRLDPHLIDVDLWHLTTTLNRARHAENDTDRTQALRPVTDLYTGDFATDLTHEWAENHREHLRRTATDALAHLAHLTRHDQPDHALGALEHAVRHDPYSEPLYRRVMELQAQLGRPDAVQRTYRLLTTRLAELDTEPDDQTHQLMTALTSS